MSAGGVQISLAVESDVPLIRKFIRELATYEKLAHEVVATEESLRRNLFGPRPFAETLIARVDGVAVGFALFFYNFSTFLGRPGLHLEDLFVDPAARGRGVGRRLLAEVARIAVERDCGRVEWFVLDWNEPAIRFYQSIGAKEREGWQVYQLAGPALRALSGAPATPRV